MYSTNLYLSMGAWFEEQNLTGFANWFRCQHLEENMHAMKFYNFINERGGRFILSGVECPETEWDSMVAVFEHVAEHEAHVTTLVNNLVQLSRDLKDFASESFLMWFVDEQVEEEDSADELLCRLKLIQHDPSAIYNMDNLLSARAPSPDVIPVYMGQSVTGGA